VAPLQRALYPASDQRRGPAPAPGCPPFGEDSVLRSDGDSPAPDNVRPGLHALGAGDGTYPVVWWDPARLALQVEPVLGLRRDDLLKEVGGVAEADRARYDAWQASRQATLERGARPSLVVRPITEWARSAETALPDLAAIDVEVIDVGPGGDRPSGPRFGTLVHAVLAAVPLDATPNAIAEHTDLQARILGATAD